jgi:trehalose 6-phosphate synthase/phosphatase
MAVSIILGNKTLELRPSSIDKATAVRALLKDLNSSGVAGSDIDFILSIGDGKTDEVVFSLLHDWPQAFTSTVGRKQTEARYYLDNVQEVESLIARLGAA